MRRNGVLMHISSLPSNYGIGSLGYEAYNFIDYLNKAGQSLWQILPVSPTGFGDSPYSSTASLAGNPYFIDLDVLGQQGYLNWDEFQHLDWGENPEQVDYAKIYENRYPVLRKAAERFLTKKDPEYEQFKKDNRDWLDDYALFMALKDEHENKAWMDWPETYRNYSRAKAELWAASRKEEMEFYKVIQYFFYSQWEKLKKYAANKGVKILGDIPFYMAMDSVDVWSRPDLFEIDADGQPVMIAGCPPDRPEDEEDKGQVWGNPLYRFDIHKKEKYDWWIQRIRHMGQLYDIVRIDHFRGFDEYYAIPYETRDAREGKWQKGPGMDLFKALNKAKDIPEIIVEDLGLMTPSLQKLLEETGYPGMKVLEYAFYDRSGEKAVNIPYNYPKNCVAYTGTHDNNTIMGWIEDTKKEDLDFARDFMHSYGTNENLLWDMIRTLLASPASTTILQAQDLKALGSWARMNQPGSSNSNWAWRIRKGALDDENAAWVRKITDTYARIPAKEEPGKKKEARAAEAEKQSKAAAKAAEK